MSDRYVRWMGRCFDCDRTVEDHDPTVCEWVADPTLSRWIIPITRDEAGVQTLVLQAGTIDVLQAGTIDDPGGWVVESRIEWDEEVTSPTGSVTVQLDLNRDENWRGVTNGGPIPGVGYGAVFVRARAILRSSCKFGELMMSVMHDQQAAVGS